MRLRTDSPGLPLPPRVVDALRGVYHRELLEEVRIHPACELAEIFNARAIAWGLDLYFARGEYAPGTSSGRFLLGHELCHAAQQFHRRVVNPFGVGIALVDEPALEAEADCLGGLLANEEFVTAGHPSIHTPAGGFQARKTFANGSVIQALRIGKIPNAHWRANNIRSHAQYQHLAAHTHHHHDVADFSDAMRTAILDQNSIYFGVNPPIAGAALPATPYASDRSTLQLWRQRAVTRIVLQVDHAIEFNHWGCNDYRNARVLSQRDNLNPATPRPGPGQIEVISLDTLHNVNFSGVNVVRGQALSVANLRTLLQAAYTLHHGGQIPSYNPTHHAGNLLHNVGQMTGLDFYAIYVNLDQEPW